MVRGGFVSECGAAGFKTGANLVPVVNGHFARLIEHFASGEFLPVPDGRRGTVVRYHCNWHMVSFHGSQVIRRLDVHCGATNRDDVANRTLDDVEDRVFLERYRMDAFFGERGNAGEGIGLWKLRLRA